MRNNINTTTQPTLQCCYIYAVPRNFGGQNVSKLSSLEPMFPSGFVSENT